MNRIQRNNGTKAGGDWAREALSGPNRRALERLVKACQNYGTADWYAGLDAQEKDDFGIATCWYFLMYPEDGEHWNWEAAEAFWQGITTDSFEDEADQTDPPRLFVEGFIEGARGVWEASGEEMDPTAFEDEGGDDVDEGDEDEIDDEDAVECEGCKEKFNVHDVLVLDGHNYCDGCYDEACEELVVEAEESCEITGPLVRNAPAHNRHCNTNYENLIEGLSRDDTVDQSMYELIRSRIDQLIEDAGPELYEGYKAGQNWAVDGAGHEALDRLVATWGNVAERRTASLPMTAARDLYECLYPGVRDDGALEAFWRKMGWDYGDGYRSRRLPNNHFVFDFIEGALAAADELAGVEGAR